MAFGSVEDGDLHRGMALWTIRFHRRKAAVRHGCALLKGWMLTQSTSYGSEHWFEQLMLQGMKLLGGVNGLSLAVWLQLWRNLRRL